MPTHRASTTHRARPLELFRIDIPAFLLLAIVVAVPLFFWPAAYTSFELPKVTLFRTLTFLLLAGTIITGLKNGRKEAALSRTDILKSVRWPLILLGLTVLSWILSVVFSSAPAVGVFGYYPRFQGLYTLACYLIFGAAAFIAAGYAKTVDRILTAVTVSSFLVALSAFAQAWGVPWLNHWDISAFLGRFFGTMGHPDYLASFLVVVIPIQTERIFANKARLLAILALSFSLAALYFTMSRAAFLGLFVALLFFILIVCLKMGFRKLFIVSLLTPVLLFGAAVSVNLMRESAFVRENALLSRLVLEDENLRSVETRLALWPATVSQIMASPFLGYGPDTYAITFPQFAPAELNTLENLGDYPDRAHNLILDYAVQFGIPGLLIFMALVTLVLARAFRKIMKNDEDWKNGEGWILPLALSSALAGLITANLFGFFVTVTWVYFWLILALLLRTTLPAAKEARKETSKEVRSEKAIKATIVSARKTTAAAARKMTIALAALALCAGAAVTWTQDTGLFAADTAYLSGDYAAAAALAPQISFYSARTAGLLTDAGDLAGAARSLEQMGRITGADGMYHLKKGILSHDFTSFEKAVAKMPTYAPAYLEYGKALYEAGQYARAAEILEKYLSLCPPYYKWTDDLASHTPQELERRRIFYKLNPDFDEVLPILADAQAKAGE
jgi:O-antigen ligase